MTESTASTPVPSRAEKEAKRQSAISNMLGSGATVAQILASLGHVLSNFADMAEHNGAPRDARNFRKAAHEVRTTANKIKG